ncbi:MAG TPA: hypothetical protein ENN80_12955 [Candidatus Hydrogenedentes bacterium]|nr:hypothetical protein [Candidatus Hydrogenedentota bacterium]
MESRKRSKDGTEGFTLIEVVIAMAITMVVMALGTAVVRISAQSLKASEAKSIAQDNVRAVMAEMAHELELAATESSPPDVYALRISNDPPEVTFQIPADLSGDNWSNPITYRYINEDTNQNAKLDPGEDEDGDGVLSRRIVRIQSGQERPLGSANNIEDVQFDLDDSGSVLSITLAASASATVGDDYNKVRAVLSSRIQLLN